MTTRSQKKNKTKQNKEAKVDEWNSFRAVSTSNLTVGFQMLRHLNETKAARAVPLGRVVVWIWII
jgi:hypothetical protein